MEVLYNKLYKLFVNQLALTNIGYTYDQNVMCAMGVLMQAIDFLENGNPTADEIQKIIQYYG